MTLDSQLAYQYVALRCVPRPDREEFVNVGVVVYLSLIPLCCFRLSTLCRRRCSPFYHKQPE